MNNIVTFTTITEVHQALGLAPPLHPLVSVIPIDNKITEFDYGDATYVMHFYQVSLKSGISGTFSYGRNTYDFQEGTMVFTRPHQAMSFKDTQQEVGASGWILLFHPDLIRRSQLGKRIGDYSFFSYDVSEALHLSEKEKKSLSELVGKIQDEMNTHIDRHTQKLVVANIELILDYCTRYYDRQFYVRTNENLDIVSKFERLLADYLSSEAAINKGLPTVKYCSEQLNMSAPYLSDLLKKETGKTAQQHIQDNIIDQAKTLLLGTNEQVSQIAYALGFEYPQHFSKLFKKQTGLSPAQYRKIN